mgnify:CR=1 FL=1
MYEGQKLSRGLADPPHVYRIQSGPARRTQSRTRCAPGLLGIHIGFLPSAVQPRTESVVSLSMHIEVMSSTHSCHIHRLIDMCNEVPARVSGRNSCQHASTVIPRQQYPVFRTQVVWHVISGSTWKEQLCSGQRVASSDRKGIRVRVIKILSPDGEVRDDLEANTIRASA